MNIEASYSQEELDIISFVHDPPFSKTNYLLANLESQDDIIMFLHFVSMFLRKISTFLRFLANLPLTCQLN